VSGFPDAAFFVFSKKSYQQFTADNLENQKTFSNFAS
jgi:hypothetical protein